MKKTKTMGQRGFTLIELMIVVAIIGILAAVAIPKFAEMLRKSKEGATKGSLTALRSAYTIYLGDNDGVEMLSRYPTADVAAIPLYMCPKYIDVIPTAKLGTYHQDGQGIVSFAAVVNTFDTNRSSLTALAAPLGIGGCGAAGASAVEWMFISNNGGYWWVACTHTDTRQTNITTW